MATTATRPAFRRLVSSPWLRPLNDLEALDDLIQPLGLIWSPTRIRARVLRVRQETADTRSYTLAVNGRWPGYQAGQHTSVTFEINGRRLRRSYSLSSAPNEEFPTITVKRHDGGVLSNALHEGLAPGTRIELAAPTGTFSVPDPMPERLLLIAAGSGITPIRSILLDLHHRGYAGEVRLLHIHHGDDRIFGAELDAMAQSWPQLQQVNWDTSQRGRPTAADIISEAGDPAQWHSMLCGPWSLMQSLQAAWNTWRPKAVLQTESFGMPPVALDASTEGSSVSCLASGRSFKASAAQPLLLSAEQSQVPAQYGCRIGVCHECAVRLESGRVRNLLTGQSIDEPGSRIQLCVCVPETAALGLNDI